MKAINQASTSSLHKKSGNIAVMDDLDANRKEFQNMRYSSAAPINSDTKEAINRTI